MTSLSLRRATAADLPLIGKLANKIWWEHYPSIISEAQIAYMLEKIYSEEPLREQMEAGGQEFWLPELNGVVQGFLSLSRTGPGEYFLHKFYLDTREKGMGTQVFKALKEQYPDARTMRLRVNRCNYKSINFYFKLGFRIEFCIDTPFGENYVMDDFQMVKQKGGLND